MSKADEMFKRLGYKIGYESEFLICYRNKRNSHIYFYLSDKSLDLATSDIHNKKLPLEQLQAINEKCKELGWL